jgi:hypothetical protein
MTMGSLDTEPRIATPDEFYAALIDAHRGLSLEQSQALNARLILLLANHVGDVDVLREALQRAREGCDDRDPSPPAHSLTT